MSALEIRLNDRIASVELVRKEKNHLEILIDGKKYRLDALKVRDGVYSLILEGRSYTVELAEGEDSKKYQVNTPGQTYDLEIIDAETRYLLSRNKGLLGDDENVISSPMPGKVVRVNVKKGDPVKTGDTVIIVSAMKMESEYKTGKDGVIKEVHVSEGDTIEGNQPLITIE